MLTYYINLILFFISLFTLIYFIYKSKKNYAFIFKTITSILFISTGIICHMKSQGDNYYFLLIIIGLIFSLFGDMFLALKINHKDGSLNKYFLYGVVSFSLTHVMYIIAFVHLGFFNIIELIVALVLAFVAISVLKSNKNIDFKNMLIPASIYSFIICLMTFESIKLVFLLKFDMGTCLLLVGALLFIFSDIVLSFILFDKHHKKYLSAINLITYYTGQFLIASTLLFF